MEFRRFAISVLIFVLILAVSVQPGTVNAQDPTPTVTQQVFPDLYYLNPITDEMEIVTQATYGDLTIDLTDRLTLDTICNGGDRSLGITAVGSENGIAYNATNPFRFWWLYTTPLFTDLTGGTIIGNGNSNFIVSALSNFSGVFRTDIDGTTIYTTQLVNWLFPPAEWTDYTYYWAGTGSSGWFGSAAKSPTDITGFKMGYRRSGGASVVHAQIYGICYGTHAPIPPSSGNLLQDGGMEQQPSSFFWFPETRNSYYAFGRFDSSGLGALGSSLQAACGSGSQIIGNLTCSSILDFFCLQARDRYADIRQRFTWPGGQLYFKYTARGQPEGGWDRNVHALIYITNLSTFTQYVLRDDMLPPEFVTRTGTAPGIPAGVYNFYVTLGSGNAPGDSFVIDDVAVSQTALDGTPCSPVMPATTATPTPGAGTPTVTSTPLGIPGPNLIDNCGFEQGEMGWRWQTSKSYVIYGLNNYSHAESDAPLPGVAQSFFWPGGPMFVRYQSNSPHNLYIRHRFTNQTYMINAGDQTAAGWITYQGTTYVPGGSYDIYLHRPAGLWPVQYDNISVSEGNYTSCQAGSNFTPTAPATATTTATPTMWPTSTQRPTSTVMPGTSTSTPRPTNTPFPTFTTVPTLVETITPRPYSTFTPYPTYTQRPTYTPLPTYTPNGEGTIEPSLTPTSTMAPQPPPDYYSDCQRPETGDVAGWIEYNRCIALSFFTWSPKAEATIIAMPTLVSGKEPFGTINEFKDTQDRMKELVDSYDWNTGIPGTSDSPDPSIFLNPGPDNPWFSGQIEFTQGTGTPISTECTARITAVLGPYLSAGYCWLVNFMQEKGITPWLQLLINLAALGFLAAYFIRKWIDAGANSE